MRQRCDRNDWNAIINVIERIDNEIRDVILM